MYYLVLFLPDLTVEFVHGPVSDRSIWIEWFNPHPECFNFSVSVHRNDLFVEEVTHDVYHTINNLSPNTTYKVCVIARDGHGNSHANWMHCADITTATVTCELAQYLLLMIIVVACLHCARTSSACLCAHPREHFSIASNAF